MKSGLFVPSERVISMIEIQNYIEMAHLIDIWLYILFSIYQFYSGINWEGGFKEWMKLSK